MLKNIFQYILVNKLFLLAISAAMISMGVIQTAQASDRHIVTVFADGQKQVIPTQADTVEAVLESIGVEIRSDDLVEPEIATQLDGRSFTVNVYRARPITINDDGELINVVTPHRSPELIAQAAGLELNDADIVSFTHSDNFVLDKSFGAVMNVDRAAKISLTQYGKNSDVFTHARTVGTFLAEQKISVDDDDRLVPSKDTPIKDGVDVKVINVGKNVVTEKEVVKFAVRTINDADKEQDYREITTAGVNGEKELSYEITLHDGNEVDRKVLSDKIVTEPVDQVVVIGVKSEVLQQVLSATSSVSGTKQQWMLAAGIPESQWWAVDSIVSGESGWNPNAVNPSSGACGLGQQLPCGKWAGAWNDPIAALIAMSGYVNSRYGSWAGAVEFRNCVGECYSSYTGGIVYKDHTWY